MRLACRTDSIAPSSRAWASRAGTTGDASVSNLAHPRRGRLQQQLAHGQRAVEAVAQQFLTGQHAGQGDLLPGDDREPPLGRVGSGRVAVYGRGLDREIDAADAGEVDGQVEEVRPVRQRRSAQVKVRGKW